MSLAKPVFVALAGNNVIITDDAVELLDAIADRVVQVLFPKDNSILLANLKRRITDSVMTQDLKELLSDLLDNGVRRVISVDTVKSMIRAHAGNYMVPLDTQQGVASILETVLSNVIRDLMQSNQNKIQAKDIVSALTKPESNQTLAALHKLPFGPLDQVRTLVKQSRSKRRSSRRSKRRSSRSKKRCPKKQISVRSFIRDGKRVKSYCRKKK